MNVNGVLCEVLVDTGCTRTVVHSSLCAEWKRRSVSMVTVSGQRVDCAGTAEAEVGVPGGGAVVLDALVVAMKPLGFCAILGMDGVKALGGVTVRSSTDVRFAGEGDVCAGAGGSVDLAVEKEDFRVVFDARERRWTVEWKWSGEKPPDQLKNGVSEYHVTDEAREEYERELETWIANGWLLEYDEEKHGSPKGLIPLMAVVQENKAKVRPVLDFREMNTHVDAFTADVDVCSEKLREWRRTGEKVALLDLKKAYLQIHVEESLWPYQTIEFKNNWRDVGRGPGVRLRGRPAGLYQADTASRSAHGVAKTLGGGGQGSRHLARGEWCIGGGSRAGQRGAQWRGSRPNR